MKELFGGKKFSSTKSFNFRCKEILVLRGAKLRKKILDFLCQEGYVRRFWVLFPPAPHKGFRFDSHFSR